MAQPVRNHVSWQNQLQNLYPNGGVGQPDLAINYLDDVLARSSSPVVIFVWKPTRDDVTWAACLAASKALNHIGAARKAGKAQSKAGSTGHVSLLWRQAAGSKGYISFWPDDPARYREIEEMMERGEQVDPNDHSAPGMFHSFVDDLKSESRLR